MAVRAFVRIRIRSRSRTVGGERLLDGGALVVNAPCVPQRAKSASNGSFPLTTGSVKVRSQSDQPPSLTRTSL